MSELPHNTASPPVIGPVLSQERIEAIDILRGVAILGILIVNMKWISLPEGLPAHELWPNMVDRTVEKLILFFADQQFITLFAFLFGLGVAEQMMRAEARGAPFLPLLPRLRASRALSADRAVQEPLPARLRRGDRVERRHRPSPAPTALPR